MKCNNILNYFRITFLSLCYYSTFSIITFMKYIQNSYRGKQEEYEKNKFTTDDDTNCKEFIYTAPLDHFSKDNKKHYCKILVDMSCSKSGDSSPMFVQREGAAGCVPCSDGLSQKYNGISVAVEHRFYGKVFQWVDYQKIPFLLIQILEC